MLALPSQTRIHLCVDPVDMRKGFDGLFILVQNVLQADPCGGHLFAFVNRHHDTIKILYWDQDGLALWSKRLESGTFRMPVLTPGLREVVLTSALLTMMLEGIDVQNIRKRRRYSLPRQ